MMGTTKWIFESVSDYHIYWCPAPTHPLSKTSNKMGQRLVAVGCFQGNMAPSCLAPPCLIERVVPQRALPDDSEVGRLYRSPACMCGGGGGGHHADKQSGSRENLSPRDTLRLSGPVDREILPPHPTVLGNQLQHLPRALPV